MTPYPDARILVIDDEAFNVVLLERALEREGYAHIASCLDSREALAKFVDYKPDLVLLDLRMPHINGYEIYDTLKTVMATWTVKVPILILTAAKEEFDRCWELGMCNFMSKPIILPELWSDVLTLLTIRFVYLELAKAQGGNGE